MAKESSWAAFCSPSLSTLVLRHHLRPTAWDITLAPGRGPFKAESYPSNWPFGGGFFNVVYAWLDLQKRSYSFGYGYGTLNSLVPGQTRPWTWQASSAIAFGGCVRHMAWRAASSFTPSGEGTCPHHQVPTIGVAKQHDQICNFLLCLGYGGDLGHHHFSPCAPAFWRRTKVVHYGYVLRAYTQVKRLLARQTVATPECGGCPWTFSQQ